MATPVYVGVSDHIRNIVVALGDSPDDIASRLLQEECFGNHTPSRCPLAVYVKKQWPFYSVCVGNRFISVLDSRLKLLGYCEHTESTQAFLRDFDCYTRYGFLHAN